MNNNNDVNTTNTNKGGGGENKNWSNAYEKFRKEASDLTEEEAKELLVSVRRPSLGVA